MSDNDEARERARKHADEIFHSLHKASGRGDGSVSIKVQFPTAAEFAMASRHVLWVLDGDHELGEEPGHFITTLIQAICHADGPNTARLTYGFPAYTTAVTAYRTEEEGLHALRTMARLI